MRRWRILALGLKDAGIVVFTGGRNHEARQKGGIDET